MNNYKVIFVKQNSFQKMNSIYQKKYKKKYFQLIAETN